MSKTSPAALTDYLNTDIECSCGRVHRLDMACIEISPGACARLPAICAGLGYGNVLLVCDRNTWRAAGQAAHDALRAAGARCAAHIFRSEALVPDERACGELMAAVTPGTDAIVAVGSGTLNDLCKYVSFKLGLPYIVYAAAPSMDGFASVGAALILDGLKTTIDTRPPIAIVADLDVLCAAPLPMISAGLADILGKYTCLIDWKLSHLVTGEYYCAEIAAMVETSLRKVVENAPRIAARDPRAIENVMHALVLTGIAMGFVGNSRPASGSEHHISHFWEMQFLFAGKPPVLHGTKVGIGAVAITRLYRLLRDMKIDFDRAAARMERFDRAVWEQEIRRVYEGAADGVIALEDRTGKNGREAHAARIAAMRAHWPEILAILDECLPRQQELESLLLSLDAPINPEQVGVNRRSLIDSILYAKEVRNRYTLLQLLWDLDLAEPMAQSLADYFASGQTLYLERKAERERELLRRVKCFVLDMDGTIYLGDRLFDYTAGFLETLRDSGKEFFFYTNNSSKNAAAYLEKLARMGIPAPAHTMMLSNAVIIEHLLATRPGQSVYLVGTPQLEQDFRDAGIAQCEDADLVVVGFDTTLVYEKLRVACDLIRAGRPFYGVNPDYNCPVEGGFIPDCGAICALITRSTGVEPEYFGKPSRHTLEYIKRKTGRAEQELAIVGDRLYTDIALAQGTGVASILVLSGETQPCDLEDSAVRPSLVCRSLAELSERLRAL